MINMIKTVRFEARCSFMPLTPVILDHYPKSTTTCISAFVSALIAYLNALCFLCLWLLFPLLTILAFFSLCFVNFHFQCQLCVPNPFIMNCLQVTKLRFIFKLPFILTYMSSKARNCWWCTGHSESSGLKLLYYITTVYIIKIRKSILIQYNPLLHRPCLDFTDCSKIFSIGPGLNSGSHTVVILVSFSMEPFLSLYFL